ncbi:MAG: TIGR02530 family flagellar biosynthesis protein [Chitinophagales bacterium]
MNVVVDKLDQVNQVSLGALRPPAGIGPAAKPAGNGAADKAKGVSFESVFTQELAKEGLKFSAHAEKRLASRNIPFSQEEMATLAAAVDRAALKGARESLVLMGDTAFVVSVRNRTVITAIDGPSLKESVFTNIDSAVIA